MATLAGVLALQDVIPRAPAGWEDRLEMDLSYGDRILLIADF